MKRGMREEEHSSGGLFVPPSPGFKNRSVSVTMSMVEAINLPLSPLDSLKVRAEQGRARQGAGRGLILDTRYIHPYICTLSATRLTEQKRLTLLSAFFFFCVSFIPLYRYHGILRLLGGKVIYFDRAAIPYIDIYSVLRCKCSRQSLQRLSPCQVPVFSLAPMSQFMQALHRCTGIAHT